MAKTEQKQNKTSQDLMSNAISAWIKELNKDIKWKTWKSEHFKYTLHFDDPVLPEQRNEAEYKFSQNIEQQHSLIMQYLGLCQTLNALKECEFYFRRYPFHGLPVTRSAHILNVCEMYFGRFYEFKERIKKYLNTLKELVPMHNLEIGKFIKQFEKTFEDELKERNHVHHHGRFESVDIDRVHLTEALAMHPIDKGWKYEHLRAYKTLSKEWAERVRTRSRTVDIFLESIAKATLDSCNFLKTEE